MQSNCRNRFVIAIVLSDCELGVMWSRGCRQRWHWSSKSFSSFAFFRSITFLLLLSSQINLLCTDEKPQTGVGERKKMCKDFTRNDFFFMLSERKSWSNDFWNGERHGVSERKRTEQRWEDQTSQQLSDEQGTEVTTRRRGGGFLSLCRRRGTGFGRGAVGLLGQRRPEGTTTHILLLLCWGRREGWRNNLDGLGLIKEKERNRQKRHTL